LLLTISRSQSTVEQPDAKKVKFAEKTEEIASASSESNPIPEAAQVAPESAPAPVAAC